MWVTYSQVPRIRTWTSLGAILLPTTMGLLSIHVPGTLTLAAMLVPVVWELPSWWEGACRALHSPESLIEACGSYIHPESFTVGGIQTEPWSEQLNHGRVKNVCLCLHPLLPLLRSAQKKERLKAGSHHHFYIMSQ